MHHEKVESTKWSAPFAKKREEVNNGDIVTIVAMAEQGFDQYNPGKKQTAIRVRIEDIGERMIGLNQTSINILIDEFGSTDDSKWVGKRAKVLLRPSVIGGKKVVVSYLVGLDYELDEWGTPVSSKKKDDEIPTINLEDSKENVKAIDPEEIPF